FLSRRSADARTRHSSRTGGATQRRPSSGLESWNEDGPGRGGARPGGRVGPDPTAVNDGLRSEYYRSSDLYGNCVVADGRGAARLLCAGATRNQSGSAGGAALRMSTAGRGNERARLQTAF